MVLDLQLDRGAVQIMLMEKIITLSKPEVNALVVEDLGDEESD
ncbi:MAG: hypothetical protein AAFO95_17930 [Cyanobacteria bacterium J06600_6]